MQYVLILVILAISSFTCSKNGVQILRATNGDDYDCEVYQDDFVIGVPETEPFKEGYQFFKNTEDFTLKVLHFKPIPGNKALSLSSVYTEFNRTANFTIFLNAGKKISNNTLPVSGDMIISEFGGYTSDCIITSNGHQLTNIFEIDYGNNRTWRINYGSQMPSKEDIDSIAHGILTNIVALEEEYVSQ